MAAAPTPAPVVSARSKRVGKYELGRTIGEGNYAKVRSRSPAPRGRGRERERPAPADPVARPAAPGPLQVKFATDTDTGEHYAIKALNRSRIEAEQMEAQIKREISVMKLVRHPNVVNLVEVLASKTTIFIVLELVTGGELFDLILAKGTRCPLHVPPHTLP